MFQDFIRYNHDNKEITEQKLYITLRPNYNVVIYQKF